VRAQCACERICGVPASFHSFDLQSTDKGHSYVFDISPLSTRKLQLVMLASDGVPVLRGHFNGTRQSWTVRPAIVTGFVHIPSKLDVDFGHNPTPANAMPSTCAENQHNARLNDRLLAIQFLQTRSASQARFAGCRGLTTRDVLVLLETMPHEQGASEDQASLVLVATTTRPSLADRQLGISQFTIPSLGRITNYSMGGAEAGATVEADAECCKRPRITLPVKRRSVGLAARGSHTSPRAIYIK